jgi:hypothetical protein
MALVQDLFNVLSNKATASSNRAGGIVVSKNSAYLYQLIKRVVVFGVSFENNWNATGG